MYGEQYLITQHIYSTYFVICCLFVFLHLADCRCQAFFQQHPVQGLERSIAQVVESLWANCHGRWTCGTP